MADKNVNKVVVNGSTIFDLTGVTVTPETLAKGVTAHDKSGAQITGTAETGVGDGTGTLVFAEASARTLEYEAGNAPTDSYVGYLYHSRYPVGIKSDHTLTILLNMVGLICGKDDDHDVTYTSGKWYKLLKIPKSDAPPENINMGSFLQHGDTWSFMSFKVDTSGVIYVKSNCSDDLDVDHTGVGFWGAATVRWN